eukprot:755098-Hanusia_phi.AAC.3
MCKIIPEFLSHPSAQQELAMNEFLPQTMQTTNTDDLVIDIGSGAEPLAAVPSHLDLRISPDYSQVQMHQPVHEEVVAVSSAGHDEFRRQEAAGMKLAGCFDLCSRRKGHLVWTFSVAIPMSRVDISDIQTFKRSCSGTRAPEGKIDQVVASQEMPTEPDVGLATCQHEQDRSVGPMEDSSILRFELLRGYCNVEHERIGSRDERQGTVRTCAVTCMNLANRPSPCRRASLSNLMVRRWTRCRHLFHSECAYKCEEASVRENGCWLCPNCRCSLTIVRFLTGLLLHAPCEVSSDDATGPKYEEEVLYSSLSACPDFREMMSSSSEVSQKVQANLTTIFECWDDQEAIFPCTSVHTYVDEQKKETHSTKSGLIRVQPSCNFANASHIVLIPSDRTKMSLFIAFVVGLALVAVMIEMKIFSTRVSLVS